MSDRYPVHTAPDAVSLAPRFAIHAATVVATVVAVAFAALAGASHAQARPTGGPLIPAYVHVQAAETVVFHAASPDDDLAWIDAVGLDGDGAASIASFRAGDGRLEVVLRLAGTRPVTLDRLVLGDATGERAPSAIGSVTVVPAAPVSGSPLVSRAGARFGAGPLLGVWLFENAGDAPVVVPTLDVGPSAPGRPIVLAEVRGEVGGPEALEAWLAPLRDAAAALEGAASETELRTGLQARLPAVRLVEGGGAEALSVPPGGALAVAILVAPAGDAGRRSVLADLRIVAVDAAGGVTTRFLPWPAEYVPRP